MHFMLFLLITKHFPPCKCQLEGAEGQYDCQVFRFKNVFAQNCETEDMQIGNKSILEIHYASLNCNFNIAYQNNDEIDSFLVVIVSALILPYV